MAPKRKSNTDSAAAAAAASTRVTRSTTRLATATTNPEPPKAKKAKTTTKKEVEKTQSPPSPTVSEPEILDGSKTIIIEHCKQCNSFKTRAMQVKDGLEKNVVGVNVAVNPEKPRRGCFEIREEGGEVFLSLLDMKRPFKPMKALDMEEVIAEIVEKIR